MTDRQIQIIDGLVRILTGEETSAFEKQCASNNIAAFSAEERKEAFNRAVALTITPKGWESV